MNEQTLVERITELHAEMNDKFDRFALWGNILDLTTGGVRPPEHIPILDPTSRNEAIDYLFAAYTRAVALKELITFYQTQPAYHDGVTPMLTNADKIISLGETAIKKLVEQSTD